MRDYRWEQTEEIAANPYGRPHGVFGQIEVWCQESPQSAMLSGVIAFVLTLIIGLMGHGGTEGNNKVPVANVSIERIILGDGMGELQALSEQLGGQSSAVVVDNDSKATADVADVAVAEVEDVFGNLQDPNASVKVDPAKAARLKSNIDKLKNGIQIAGLPEATTMGGGVPISGVFKALMKDSPTCVLVIDKSGSMYGTPLDRVSGELAYAINALSEEQSFFVIFFDNTTWPMFSNYGSSALGNTKKIQLIPGNEKSKRDAIAWINTMEGSGGTEPGGAMLMALAARPHKIVLLSDGEFSRQYVQEIANQNKSNTIIDCIGLAEDIQTLQEIASQNNGKYYPAK